MKDALYSVLICDCSESKEEVLIRKSFMGQCWESDAVDQYS